MRLKTKLYVWKAFPFGNVLGISNQKFCLNGKGPWCQFWELPQKTSSSRLVQNGSTLTKLELVTISSDKLNMLWPSFTLGSNMYYLFFSWRLWMSYITMTQNKSSSNLEPKHTLLPVSCRHFWPSISFYLMLIFLFSRPPHLILLSILANPIFIFNSKISSYNPIFFKFFTELLNPWLPVVPSFVLNLCLQKHSRKGWTWSVKKKMWIVITRYGKMVCSENGWK